MINLIDDNLWKYYEYIKLDCFINQTHIKIKVTKYTKVFKSIGLSIIHIFMDVLTNLFNKTTH